MTRSKYEKEEEEEEMMKDEEVEEEMETRGERRMWKMRRRWRGLREEIKKVEEQEWDEELKKEELVSGGGVGEDPDDKMEEV